MVDLGFLLITFFVFTTNLGRSNAMNLIMPMDGEQMPVKESGSMTILIGIDHQLFYYYGKLVPGKAQIQIKQSSFKTIRGLITAKKRSTPMHDLMFLIKADKRSTFKDIVDLLDEMVICDIPKGHYAEVELTVEEQKAMIGQL